MEMITLNDGNKIPAVGFGVFLVPNDGPAYEAVSQALKAGYRHIDTAAAYFNESDVGKAVKDSGIPREEIFITSKLWLQDYGYEAARKGLETSLESLVWTMWICICCTSHTAMWPARGKRWRRQRRKAG